MGDPAPAWGRQAPNGLEVDVSPGNHCDMISPVNTPVLVLKIKRAVTSYIATACQRRQ